MIVYDMALSINLRSQTIEQVVNKLKESHNQLLEIMIDQAGGRSSEAAGPFQQLQDAVKDRPGEWFNVPTNLLQAVNAATEAQSDLYVERLKTGEGLEVSTSNGSSDSKFVLVDVEKLGHESSNSKFVHDEKHNKPGDFMSFHKGLDGLIGSPNPEIRKTMMREHCSSDDSLLEFRASNYQTATTSQIEWYFVADPNSPPKTFKIIRMEEARRDDRIAAWRYGANRRNPTLTSMPFPKARSVKGWPQERRYGSVGHRGRSPFPPSFFEADVREKNRKLNERGASEISMEEFLGARLYTGP